MKRALQVVARIQGARQRELAARHWLLHLDQLDRGSEEDLRALGEYVRAETWKSLYGHDRAMYLLLRAGVEKYRADLTLLATIPLAPDGSRLTAARLEENRSQLEQRLQAHLDKRCVVTRQRHILFVFYAGRLSVPDKSRKALGVKRIGEREAA